MKATEKIPAGQAPAEELPSCSHIIRRRRNAAEIKSGYIRLAADIAALAVIGILLFTQVFLVMQAPGNGMFPAIKDGDLIIGFRMQGEYVKDDVVVYEADGKTHVGRIMGRETDVITMDDTGTLFVNGTVQGGEIPHLSGRRHRISIHRTGRMCVHSGGLPDTGYRQPGIRQYLP